MADAIVSFGVEKLWELLSREYELLEGAKEQVTELRNDLNMLMSFLKDADDKKHKNALARNCVEEVKEITYDAEDIIETFLLKEERRNKNGIKNRMRGLPCIPGGRRDIALEITSISQRISNVIRRMHTFSIDPLIKDGGYSQALRERKRETRLTFSSESESNLVGLEKNVDKLVKELVEKDSTRVVSITGLGGLGKTTLARHVFNDETIKRHFDGLAWVCVSQVLTRKNVLRTILRDLSTKDKDSTMKDDKYSGMEEEDIRKKLIELETQKALIVIDDIWTKKDWDEIKQMFPKNKVDGWKVLLTSRNDAIDRHCVTFKPEALTPEECWTLLQKIAFPKNDTTGYKVDEEMEEMAKEMIKHCGGLPLAVKVLGGLLAMQHTSREWKMLSENIRSHIVGGTSSDEYDSSSVSHVLSLSFEGLPVYLKHCILHLASFPEDCEIEIEKLSYVLAAEGVPRPIHYDEATIRDVADVYIDELVKRNMVISERDSTTSRYETCQLHDIMREMCLSKAKEENFLEILTPRTVSSTLHSHASKKSRRLVVHCSNTFHGERERKNPKLRSLLFISDKFTRIPMESGLSFTELQLMRVLDLSYAQFEGGKLPSSIGKLIHLRYLSLYGANVTHLPSSMRNLKLLLYLNLELDVTYQVPVLYMPNSLLKEMRELRYLFLPRKMHGKVKLELGNLVNLETLTNFSTEHGSVSDLQSMTRLRVLSIYIKGKGCNIETLSSSLREMIHLENLTIMNYMKNAPRNDKEGLVLDCVNLRQLKLEIHMPKLPDEQRLPSQLTTISLEDCGLEEDPMPILEKLLHLKEVTLMRNSFRGKKMVCSARGFPQLETLEINKLKEWEEWIVEEGSMPLLHTLKVWNCRKLKELPNELQFITSLKKVCLVYFGGKRMVCSARGFPQLETLDIYGLEELEEWIVEEGSMPLLHTLFIWDCRKLKELPNELQFITSLKKVCLVYFGGKRMVCSARWFPQLETLDIYGLEEWEEWIVEEGSMPLLHTLNVWNCQKLKELPNELQFITSLKTVCLRSFGGRRIVCSGRGFPQLETLEIFGLEELEEWIVEEGSMPLLHTLKVWNCPKLKELPDGLRFITSLKDLKVGREWKERVSEGGEDYSKIQHIPFVTIREE